MEDISSHILDIVENSINADAKNIEIVVEEDKDKDLLLIEIKDDGKGMSKEYKDKVLDPFVTTRTTRRVGLGLPLLSQAAKMSGGELEIETQEGKGTDIKATFGYSNIDRQPLGDLAEAIKILIMTNPHINFIFRYKDTDKNYLLDTREKGN